MNKTTDRIYKRQTQYQITDVSSVPDNITASGYLNMIWLHMQMEKKERLQQFFISFCAMTKYWMNENIFHFKFSVIYLIFKICLCMQVYSEYNLCEKNKHESADTPTFIPV